jgi:hypothetical protein
MVAQQWRHDGVVATTGRGGKGQLTGRGAPFKGCTRRWPRAAEMVGGTAGGNSGGAMSRQGGGRSPNTVGTAAPLFEPCG